MMWVGVGGTLRCGRWWQTLGWDTSACTRVENHRRCKTIQAMGMWLGRWGSFSRRDWRDWVKLGLLKKEWW